MASEAAPRLDMSLDDIIKLHKKEDASKGKGRNLRRPLGRGSARGRGQGRGIKVQQRDGRAARAQDAQNRSAADRQDKLAQKRGLPVGQQATDKSRSGPRRGQGVPLSRGGIRGRGSRGTIRVRGRGGGRASTADVSRIRITIDNHKLYHQTVQQQQQVAYVPRPLNGAAQGPTIPAWGSAYYNGAPANQGPRAEPISAAPYVPFQGVRSGGGVKYVDTPAGGSGVGRGFGSARRGAGGAYDRFQGRGNASRSAYGGYPPNGGYGVHADGPPGRRGPGPARMGTSGLHY